MTYGFEDNSLTHCATLLSNNYGKENNYNVIFALLFILVRSTSQYVGVPYHIFMSGCYKLDCRDQGMRDVWLSYTYMYLDQKYNFHRQLGHVYLNPPSPIHTLYLSKNKTRGELTHSSYLCFIFITWYR